MEKEQKKSWLRTGNLYAGVMMLCGSVLAFCQTMDPLSAGIWKMLFVALVGMLCCEAAWLLHQNKKTGFWIVAVPWITLFVIDGFYGCFSGMKYWINGMIQRWDMLHEGGIPLFAGTMSVQDSAVFAMWMALFMGQLLWLLIVNGHLVFPGWLWGNLWVILMLVEEHFDTTACGLIFCGLLCAWIMGKKDSFTGAKVFWVSGITLCCVLAVFFVPAERIPEIEQLRLQTRQRLHELRYGEEQLPEGDLRQAETFQTETGEMLQVTSEQEKTLYLKAFTGGIYRNGRWDAMPDSAYGGEYAGMLKWLKERNFDPLMQSAAYYSIGAQEEIEENVVQVQVLGASREYFYAPDSFMSALPDTYKEKKEYGLLTTGLTGQRSYAYTELSGSRPAELTVADDWVKNPQTEEERTYSEAEAVYREFVYNYYTAIDENTCEIVNDIFWKDYDTENDGIYSAITQIRTKLKESYEFTGQPKTEGEENPLAWFLETSYSGNAMLYASAAVEALRAHGIPARYVEGYYAPASAFAASEDGRIVLTGENAHAWAEVYFDGIGWLPVDVTPGYYYDVASLQKMVSTPDQVRKKAALADNQLMDNQASGLDDGYQSNRKKFEDQVKTTSKVFLGVLAVLIICLTAVVLLLELCESIVRLHIRRAYQKANETEKVQILKREIYLILNNRGIKAQPGFQTKETDVQLAEQLPDMEAGEYTRICQLLEKQIYGDIPLETFEIRVLANYCEKLAEEKMPEGMKEKIRMHFRHVWAVLHG